MRSSPLARLRLIAPGGGGGPENVSVPTIDADPVIGTAMSATAGTWDDTYTLTYQWQSSADGSTGWSDISGATAIDWTPTGTEFGYYLRVAETADGLTTAYSAASSIVTNGLAAPLAYWELEEASGARADSVGSNNLADNNTVTQAAGVQGNAASFASANNEYLSIADNTDLSAGDVAFTIGAWVRLTTLQNAGLICKWNSGLSDAEYALIYNATQFAPNSNFTFLVSVSGSTNFRVQATTFGTPSTDTWYFVMAWHDPTGDTINISVNNGTANSTAHTTGVRDGTSPFVMGMLSPGTAWPLDGRLDEVFFFKRLLTDYEKAWLYNGGTGRSYAEVAAVFP